MNTGMMERKDGIEDRIKALEDTVLAQDETLSNTRDVLRRVRNAQVAWVIVSGGLLVALFAIVGVMS